MISGHKRLPRLTKIRMDRGLTRDELADLVGCCERTIERAEGSLNMKQPISTQTAVEIAQALGVELDDLLDKPLPKPYQNLVAIQQGLLNYRSPQRG